MQVFLRTFEQTLTSDSVPPWFIFRIIAQSDIYHWTDTSQMEFVCKFKGVEQSIRLSQVEFEHVTVDVLKSMIASLFSLDVKTVKLLGIPPKTGGDVRVKDLGLKKTSHKINVVGSSLSEINSMVAKETLVLEQERLREEAAAQRKLEEERIRVQMEEKRRIEEEIMAKKLEETRVQRRLAEMEVDRPVEVKDEVVRMKLRSFSNWELTSNFNEDRVVLSPTKLEELVSRNVQFPLLFRVSKGDSVAFVGVKDFNGVGDDLVSVPTRILQKLNAEEGEELLFETIPQVSKGEFVKLKPINGFWLRIPAEEREALLEFELRKLQFLVQGNLLKFTYDLHDFQILIEETKPNEVISLADTELSTEIMDPEEKIDSIPQLPMDGTEIEIDLKEGDTKHYEVNVKDPHSIVKIQVTPKDQSGDFSLYCSFDTFAPNFEDFQWCSQEKGANIVEISNADAEFKTSILYVGVTCHLVEHQKIFAKCSIKAIAGMKF